MSLARGEARSIDLEIPPGLALRIHVVDRDGAAVAGAQVLLSLQPDITVGAPIALTDADGWCELTDVEPGRMLWVAAEGYETSYAQPAVESGEIRIALTRPGFALEGRVIDAESGAGIARASVRVDGYRTPGSVVEPDGTTRVFLPPPSPLARTDEHGFFRISASESAGLSLFAYAQSYASKRVPLERELLDSRSIEVALQRSEGLFGFVVTPEEEPLPFAQLKLRTADGSLELLTQAEDDGSFWISGAPLGEVTVEARAKGGYFGVAATHIEPDGSNALRVVADAAGAVLVSAATEEGSPLEGCTIVRIVEPEVEPPFLTLRHLGRTDPKGECRIARQALEGSAEIGLLLKGVKPSFPYRTATWRDGMASISFRVPAPPAAGALSFDCRWSDPPLATTLVSIFVCEQSAGIWLGRTPDEQGACSYEGLAAGTYRAIASVSGAEYELGLFPLAAGEERRIRFDPSAREELPRASWLEGR